MSEFEIKNTLPSIKPIAAKPNVNFGGKREFKKVTPGWYYLKCNSFEPTISKDNKNGFKFVFEVTAGEFKGSRVWYTVYPYNFTKQQLSLVEFMKSTGLQQNEVNDILENPSLLNCLVGLEVMGRVEEKPWKDKTFINLTSFAPNLNSQPQSGILDAYKNGIKTVETLTSPKVSAKLM